MPLLFSDHLLTVFFNSFLYLSWPLLPIHVFICILCKHGLEFHTWTRNKEYINISTVYSHIFLQLSFSILCFFNFCSFVFWYPVCKSLSVFLSLSPLLLFIYLHIFIFPFYLFNFPTFPPSYTFYPLLISCAFLNPFLFHFIIVFG